MLEKTNWLGMIVTHVIYVLSILVFASRLLHRPRWGYWIGVLLMVTALPLGYLLLKAPLLRRPPLYYVQIGLMLAYLLVEFLLDYALKIDFRHVRWIAISYVTLFFAATGGMLGVAALAGRLWTISAVLLFFAMSFLAFVQHAVTGE